MFYVSLTNLVLLIRDTSENVTGVKTFASPEYLIFTRYKNMRFHMKPTSHKHIRFQLLQMQHLNVLIFTKYYKKIVYWKCVFSENEILSAVCFGIVFDIHLLPELLARASYWSPPTSKHPWWRRELFKTAHLYTKSTRLRADSNCQPTRERESESTRSYTIGHRELLYVMLWAYF